MLRKVSQHFYHPHVSFQHCRLQNWAHYFWNSHSSVRPLDLLPFPQCSCSYIHGLQSAFWLKNGSGTCVQLIINHHSPSLFQSHCLAWQSPLICKHRLLSLFFHLRLCKGFYRNWNVLLTCDHFTYWSLLLCINDLRDETLCLGYIC